MTNLALQEKFIEDQSFRDQYIVKTEVMNKVKLLSLLPDGESMTVQMVADYYEVNKTAIDQVLHRHKDEFKSDGVKKVTSKSEGFDILSKALNPNQFIVKLIPRRSILRIGMLLRDSEIAKQVRTYLLNVEESASKEQRSKAMDHHLVTWTPKEELILLDCYYSTINNGGTLGEAAQKASEKINHTKAACLNKYNNSLKTIITDEKFFETVEQNKKLRGRKKNHLQLVTVEETASSVESVYIDNGMLEQIHNSQTIVIDDLFKKNSNLLDDVFKLKDDNTMLRLRVNELESDKTMADFITMDKDRLIEQVNEKNQQLSEEVEKWKKKYAESKKKLSSIEDMITGRSQAKKKQVESKENKGMQYTIKDGVPVFK
ncbi:hypothetical protein [Paenibacillus cremeus]|uniref:Uncharacterized protein n=1 Tax=Paenibacillus cremeus TaxID=2163881 RepID=A0A559KCR6_9BACL|nr:hypothetical protein [Paenibacillus cremeus]TVY09921.1 hypothetical protein FPZ49_11155 [Paenibacillus cremeus]